MSHTIDINMCHIMGLDCANSAILGRVYRLLFVWKLITLWTSRWTCVWSCNFPRLFWW